MDRTFKLVSIDRTDAPEGGSGCWHRYVIENEYTVIDGCAKGSKRAVTRYVRNYVNQLNAKDGRAKRAAGWVRRKR